MYVSKVGAVLITKHIKPNINFCEEIKFCWYGHGIDIIYYFD